jgi:C-terminal processing protease CtpA/Prc
MKRIIALLMLSLISFGGFCQTNMDKPEEVPDKASPFTAVDWGNEEPLVKFEGAWYGFVALDTLSKDRILNFCKSEYGDKWQKRFSEDMVEVLREMKHYPKKEVTITLEKDGETVHKVGLLLAANRQSVRKYNVAEMKRVATFKKISKKSALKDLGQLQTLLKRNASYLGLTGFDYKGGIANIKASIEDSILVRDFGFAIQKLIGELGDRHARVSGFSSGLDGFLPFAVAPLDEKVVALHSDTDGAGYSFYLNDFPYLKSIDGILVNEFMSSITWQDKYAPEAAKFHRGVREIREIRQQYYKLKGQIPDSIAYTFANVKQDTTIVLSHSKRMTVWNDVSDNYYPLVQESIEDETYDALFELKENAIGYIRLPDMLDAEEAPKLFDLLTTKMEDFKETKALVIDIRNNGGGTRALLMKLAPYFISPSSEPWVANVAKIRSDGKISGDDESMQARYLYSYSSTFLTDRDRGAIDVFLSGFNTTWKYKKSKYSKSFYMVLSHEKGKNHYYYSKPIYILMNERCFSAASVFASALKGLPNITLAGINTDGSSGRSQYYSLENSEIKIKLSSMISFQRNGKTLDTNGTEPDIILSKDFEQVLGNRDTQLTELLLTINK